MIADSILKGALLKFKRAPFACQKGIFYNAKRKGSYSIRYKRQETPVSDEETKKKNPRKNLQKS